MKNLMLAVFVLALAGVCSGQQDIVYLKNGSVIHGTVVETIPDSIVKVQTTDGSVFVWRMNDVEKISKEILPSEEEPSPPTNPVKMKRRHKNPYVAGVLSFLLPGAGQYYNGEISKGLAMTAVRIIGVAMMLNGTATNTTYYGGYYYQETVATPGYWVGLAINVGSFIWSVIDAPVSSGRINREREREMGLNIKPVSNGDGMTVGLAYRF